MIEKIAFSLPGNYQLNPVEGMPSGGKGAVIKFIESGLTYLFIAAIILALIFLILGGIQWILSQGDKTKVEAARKRITFAIIGLIITFSAFFIINMIGWFFGGVNLLGFPKCNSGFHYECKAHTCKCLPN